MVFEGYHVWDTLEKFPGGEDRKNVMLLRMLCFLMMNEEGHYFA